MTVFVQVLSQEELLDPLISRAQPLAFQTYGSVDATEPAMSKKSPCSQDPAITQNWQLPFILDTASASSPG